METEITEAVRQFQIEGELIDVKLHKNGHINNTYLSVWNTSNGRRHYIHQTINHSIFPDVEGLMNNIALVTEHLKNKLEGLKTGERTLEIIPTREGRRFYLSPSNHFWRTYNFIENSESYDQAKDANHAYEAASAFGRFAAFLADVDPSQLVDTIPHFHDTPRRIEALKASIKADSWNRVSSVKKEIEFVLSREEVCGVLMREISFGRLPLRVTHNDMKLNNLLFDISTKKAVCVVDLDTCMAGSSLFDFGDLVRITSVPSAEDERDLSRVNFSLELYRALTKGYLETFGPFMVEAERELLAYGPLIITMTIGIRMLTDYLSGDVYFKIHRPEHNLDRARTQFKAALDMEQSFKEMEAIVREYSC